MCTKDPDLYPYVFVNNEVPKHELIATLAHELLHATNSIFDDVGIYATTKENEITCQVQGWLLETCLKELKV